MEPVRPLRDVFADLASDDAARQAHAADPSGFLESYGHPELPNDLVSEAIVNYADTAPAEVAEHLAPFVIANGPVPGEGGPVHGDGLGLLASAPVPDLPEDGFDDLPAGADDPHGAFDGLHATQLDPADPFDLDFGGGHQVDHDPADLAHDSGHPAGAEHWLPADHGVGTELGTDADVTPYVGEPMHDLDLAAADVDSDTAHHEHHAMQEPGTEDDRPTDAGDWADS
jgi:hypothetical protein